MRTGLLKCCYLWLVEPPHLGGNKNDNNKDIINIIFCYLSFLALPIFNKDHVMEFSNASDVIDSLCNIAMASAAVYAAWNAKDWLSPKINAKKFKFADELIDLFCKIQEEDFYLHSETKSIINSDPDVQGDVDKFRKIWNQIKDQNYTYRKNTINLRTTMERMAL